MSEFELPLEKERERERERESVCVCGRRFVFHQQDIDYFLSNNTYHLISIDVVVLQFDFELDAARMGLVALIWWGVMFHPYP